MSQILSANTEIPNIIRGPNIGIKGEIRAILRNPDGSIAQDNGWQPNRILNQGLTRMGDTASWGNNGNVGSSSAAIVDTQTGCQSYLGNTFGSTFIERTDPAVAPNYEAYHIARWRFNAGVATGTIREFGIGTSTNNSCSTRVLVSPAMTKSASQVLDIYYKMTMYPDLATYTGTIDIVEDGVAVPYNVISRGQVYHQGSKTIFNVIMGALSGGSSPRFMDGNLGAGLTGYPSGTTAGGYPNYLTYGYIGASPYGTVTRVGDTAYKDVYLAANLDTGNISSGLGIRSAFMDFDIGYAWGVQYNRVSDDGRIQKNNTRIIQLNFRHSWTRL